MAGKKPSRSTSKDMRLKTNGPKAAAPAAPSAGNTAAPKFGSPAWRAKYDKK
jgi:hypothetical protein